MCYILINNLDYGDVFYIVLMIIIDWFYSDVYLVILIKMLMYVNKNYEFVKVRWFYCSVFVYVCYLYSYWYLVSMF